MHDSQRRRFIPTITILSSLAVKEAYLELAPQFEKKTGHKVETEWLGMVDIKKRIRAGEVVDAAIAWRNAIAELKDLGKLTGLVDVAKSWVAVAVKKGARRPDIASAEALKRELRGARSVAYSSGPSGVYLAELFRKWGLADELKGRMTQTQPGTAVGPLVASGEVEIGFQQMSELLPVAGIDIVGPLPAEIQVVSVFSGAVHVAARQAAVARDWLAFIAAGAPVLRKHGMDPA